MWNKHSDVEMDGLRELYQHNLTVLSMIGIEDKAAIIGSEVKSEE